MIRLDIQLDSRRVSSQIAAQTAAMRRLRLRSIDEFRKLTPIDTGRARRSTTLKNNSSVIHADYPYAERLDQNWSRQTRGRGIVAPFIRWWRAAVARIGRIR
jgi:hypothetical protein